ncbi:MAG TPA: hypothetical protein VFV07_01410 [Rhizomicrobium sp.]|nr:hypothetical protein [Rhizomicrobium sp.]
MRAALKSAALIVAVLAMTLRAAMPDGWMPSADASAPIMLCPGMNAMPMPLQKQHHDQGHPSTYCVCAAVAQLAAPGDDTHALLSEPASVTIAFDAAHDAPFLARAYAPNAARGPPVSA